MTERLRVPSFSWCFCCFIHDLMMWKITFYQMLLEYNCLWANNVSILRNNIFQQSTVLGLVSYSHWNIKKELLRRKTKYLSDKLNKKFSIPQNVFLVYVQWTHEWSSHRTYNLLMQLLFLAGCLFISFFPFSF